MKSNRLADEMSAHITMNDDFGIDHRKRFRLWERQNFPIRIIPLIKSVLIELNGSRIQVQCYCVWFLIFHDFSRRKIHSIH